MKLVQFALVMGLSLTLAGSAGADTIDWGTPPGPDGYTNTFNWSSGSSEEGLWGDPDITDDGFFFNNMDPQFKAEATNPSSDLTLSEMHVSINTYGYDPIMELHVYEHGIFTGNIEDVYDADNHLTWATLQLFVIDPMTYESLDFPLTFDFNVGEGTWTASAHVDVASLGGDYVGGLIDFDLDLPNYLRAQPLTPGGTAMIQKLGGAVIIPEPASLLLGLFGLVTISLRRSR